MLPQDVPLVIKTVSVISVDKSPTHLNPTVTPVSTLVFPDVYAYTVISPEPPAFPWFASAGYTRGLVNSVKARVKLTQEDRDTLYQGRINPIATFSDVGTVIWGNKTLQVADTGFQSFPSYKLKILVTVL